MEHHAPAHPVTMKGAESGRELVLRNRRISHVFHITAVIYMTVMVIIGFWPSYFGQFFSGLPARHWVIHLHAGVFTGWMLLLLLQVSLVAAGKTRYHKKLGLAGGAYGIAIIALGLAATFIFPLHNISNGTVTLDAAASFLIIPLVDLLLFGGFFAAALWYRGRHEIHKRLILAASVVLIFPAVARMFMADVAMLPYILLVWLFPILAGIILDAILNRRVHPVYLISTAILLLSMVRVPVMESETWVSIGRALLRMFM